MPASHSLLLALFQRIGKELFYVGFDAAEEVVAEFVRQVEGQIRFSVAGAVSGSVAVFVDESSGVVDGAVLDDENLHLPTSPLKVLQRDRFSVEPLAHFP